MNLKEGLTRSVTLRGAEIAGRGRDRLERALRSAAPISTPTPTSTSPPGELRRATSVSVRRSAFGFTFRALADKDYASYTNKGTRPHQIRPRGGGVLRFYWKRMGSIVFFPEVSHPGSRGTRWFDKTLDRFGSLLR